MCACAGARDGSFGAQGASYALGVLTRPPWTQRDRHPGERGKGSLNNTVVDTRMGSLLLHSNLMRSVPQPTVQVTHNGLCHTDVHMVDNDWGVSAFPFIPGELPSLLSAHTEFSPTVTNTSPVIWLFPGHEVIGYVTAKGDQVHHLQASAASHLCARAGQCPLKSIHVRWWSVGLPFISIQSYTHWPTC